MKKLLWASFILPLTLLVAFQVKQNDVLRVSTQLYTVNSVSRISTADREVVRKAITDYYGLKDVRQERIVISQNDPRNKAGWIFSESVYKDWFSSKFISWKNKAQLPREAIRVQTVLKKYAVNK